MSAERTNMTVLEATDLLRRKARESDEVRMMVALASSTAGYADLFDWAYGDPDNVLLLAGEVLSIEEQEAEFERRLASGDLS